MGGFYNFIFGYNPYSLWIMPMLGRKENEWPRFRDCYVEKIGKEWLICIYTRVGGNNRNSGFGEEKLYEDPLFVSTEDDDYDSTYAVYRFKVPEKWKRDFYAIINNNMWQVSKKYRQYLKEFFPKLNDAGFFDDKFKKGMKR